jgi:hypothetical protein
MLETVSKASLVRNDQRDVHGGGLVTRSRFLAVPGPRPVWNCIPHATTKLRAFLGVFRVRNFDREARSVSH